MSKKPSNGVGVRCACRYNSGNECLAIKPDASLGSLHDALNERLHQAQAVIQVIWMLATDAAERGSPSDDVTANALWAADMLIEQTMKFLAELDRKDTHGPIKPGTDLQLPESTLKKSPRKQAAQEAGE